MYYEIHGDGPPLVPLHGALSAIGTSFGRLLPSLARTRRLIAVEQQAHGHTADRDRSLTIGQMADDTVALLEHLGVANADILGYSMGAGVALEIALRRPALVRRLVVVSLAYTHDGLYPELLAGEENLKPEDLAGTPRQEEYARIAPNPEDWPALVGKVQQMDREFVGWPAEAVRSVGRPTSSGPSTRWRCCGCSAAASPAISPGIPAPGSPCSPGPPTSRSWAGPTG